MPNNYITLNGKKYRTTGRAFTDVKKKALQVNTTLGKKTTSQDFGFTDNRFTLKILVNRNPASGFGSHTDLETAYGLTYVSFIDQYGITNDVFMEGQLNLPFNFAVVDETVDFEVSLSLRKRQT